MIKKREEIAQEERWSVESFYDWETWEQEIPEPPWIELTAFKGKLHEGPEILKACLKVFFKLQEKIERFYTYAHLRHDEDITHDKHRSAFDRITALYFKFQQETAWFEPEVLTLPEKFLDALPEYQKFLDAIWRMKPHTLSPEKEELLAQSANALQTPYKAFSAINNADFKFGRVSDSNGKQHELTHGQYSVYLRSRDRTLRENAFKTMHGTFESYQNTIGTLLSGQVQKNLFLARAKKYDSCVEAALYPNNIPLNVYHALIETVNERLPSLHRYLDLRKKILDVDELKPYDLYVPLIEDVDITMSYEEAEEHVIASVAPLGKEYQNDLKRGLMEQRWVDRYENLNKRSGAYSSGCYKMHPFILMNYRGQLRDVFTLAHEAGHSMHSLNTWKTQPYHYSSYAIFVAEVASTYNEGLLSDHLLNHLKSPREKAYLINEKIEDIRSTLFRQAMFAEYELCIHTAAEKGEALTPKRLNDEYEALCLKYLRLTAPYEWARIPHFYYNFYVYQYATGISAALALLKTSQDYLGFLKAGSSLYPMDALMLAGVDMSSSAPVHAAIDKFDVLVGDLAETLEKC